METLTFPGGLYLSHMCGVVDEHDVDGGRVLLVEVDGDHVHVYRAFRV